MINLGVPAARTPGDILTSIAELVTQREEDHGSWHRNLETAAKLWSVILGIDVRGDQVANCMLSLKIARQITSKGKTDDYDDAIGYAALAAAWFEHEEKSADD